MKDVRFVTWKYGGVYDYWKPKDGDLVYVAKNASGRGKAVGFPDAKQRDAFYDENNDEPYHGLDKETWRIKGKGYEIVKSR